MREQECCRTATPGFKIKHLQRYRPGQAPDKLVVNIRLIGQPGQAALAESLLLLVKSAAKAGVALDV